MIFSEIFTFQLAAVSVRRNEAFCALVPLFLFQSLVPYLYLHPFFEQRGHTVFLDYKGDPPCVYPLMIPCELSHGITTNQLLVLPCQKYLSCAFACFLPGYLLTCHKTITHQRKIYALGSKIISWVSEPGFWKDEFFPCCLWPQDVKLALAFADSFVAPGFAEKACFVCLFFISLPALKDNTLSSFSMDSHIHMLSLWLSKLLQIS